ncbi:S-adenosyl-L-methionine-dependentmethyltransferases superfamily protein [Striga asiatica]|uniref:S-adenosyl-L-methionine-dependentmethyltransferases superfamily protein n=1 Tax=Striga asiatica TaxID=4170 RepID=A0A5A7NZ66_STRAF|nr:S-adenosyl-L-methionine-dependentmethyltransferases superfamily protein [Striga asiatica]
MDIHGFGGHGEFWALLYPFLLIPNVRKQLGSTRLNYQFGTEATRDYYYKIFTRASVSSSQTLVSRDLTAVDNNNAQNVETRSTRFPASPGSRRALFPFPVAILSVTFLKFSCWPFTTSTGNTHPTVDGSSVTTRPSPLNLHALSSWKNAWKYMLNAYDTFCHLSSPLHDPLGYMLVQSPVAHANKYASSTFSSSPSSVGPSTHHRLGIRLIPRALAGNITRPWPVRSTRYLGSPFDR